MTSFILFLDDAGAEFTHARTNRKQIVAAERNRVLRVKPTAIRPLEVIDAKSSVKRGAGGFLLLGPLGAAIGLLTGKGPTVLFELEMPDDLPPRRGVIEQERYPALRNDIEAMQSYKEGSLAKGCASWSGLVGLTALFTAAIGPAGLIVAPLLWFGTGEILSWAGRRLRRS